MSLLSSWKNGYRRQSLGGRRSDDIDVEEKFLDSPDGERRSMDSSSIPNERRQSSWLSCKNGLTAANVLILCTTIGLNVVKPSFSTPQMNTCVRETSFYSPIIESESIEFHNVQFNGTLWPPTENVPWSRREPGDPEAEAIWEGFELADTFPITREQVLALGKDPETAAKYPDDYWGLGDDAYIASLDGLHKIHCLNELRKMTFVDYGDASPEKHEHGQLWWIHLRHCVDMLTQDMMCHADADLLTYNWMDTQVHPFPDFSINRKCKSLEPLLKYRDEHKVDMEKYMAMPKPKSGIRLVPNEPGYYAMFGFTGSHLFPDGEGHPPLPEPTWPGRKHPQQTDSPLHPHK